MVEHIQIERYGWQAPRYAMGANGECRLDIFKHDNGFCTVVASELPDNPGASITNAAESLWSQVAEDLDLSPAQLRAVEHYPHQPRVPEHYDLVVLSWKGGEVTHVGWKRLSAEDYPDFFQRIPHVTEQQQNRGK